MPPSASIVARSPTDRCVRHRICADNASSLSVLPCTGSIRISGARTGSSNQGFNFPSSPGRKKSRLVFSKVNVAAATRSEPSSISRASKHRMMPIRELKAIGEAACIDAARSSPRTYLALATYILKSSQTIEMVASGLSDFVGCGDNSTVRLQQLPIHRAIMILWVTKAVEICTTQADSQPSRVT